MLKVHHILRRGNLHKKNSKLCARTYLNHHNLYLYIPPLSTHPISWFKGLIIEEILRYWQQNTSKKDFITTTQLFVECLLKHGHTFNPTFNQ
jgi:hypothetical protein